MTGLKPSHPGSKIKLAQLTASLDNYKSGTHDELYSSLQGNKNDNTNPIVKKDLSQFNTDFNSYFDERLGLLLNGCEGGK